jgi:hypothetical protein
MRAIFPTVLFFLVGITWVSTAIQGVKLYESFITKFPKEAQERIPYAFSRIRHPEKTIFFFRGDSITLLRGDPEVWKLRQRFKMLLSLSALVPLIGFLIIACVARPNIHFAK